MGILTKNSTEMANAPHMPGALRPPPPLGLDIDRCIKRGETEISVKDHLNTITKCLKVPLKNIFTTISFPVNPLRNTSRILCIVYVSRLMSLEGSLGKKVRGRDGWMIGNCHFVLSRKRISLECLYSSMSMMFLTVLNRSV